jgi:hypothetical protein
LQRQRENFILESNPKRSPLYHFGLKSRRRLGSAVSVRHHFSRYPRSVIVWSDPIQINSPGWRTSRSRARRRGRKRAPAERSPTTTWPRHTRLGRSSTSEPPNRLCWRGDRAVRNLPHPLASGPANRRSSSEGRGAGFSCRPRAPRDLPRARLALVRHVVRLK